MKHIMLDLETMGSSSTAAIVAIGAVEFDPLTGKTGATIEINVNLNSSAHYGKMDASTVQWWLRQSEQARAIFNGDATKMTLKNALLTLNSWLEDIADKSELQIWGNGSNFDNVILMNAYEAVRLPASFTHWNDRDVRTIVEMGSAILGINPKKELVRQGVLHSALDDALFQAQYVSHIWRAFASLIPAKPCAA